MRVLNARKRGIKIHKLALSTYMHSIVLNLWKDSIKVKERRRKHIEVISFGDDLFLDINLTDVFFKEAEQDRALLIQDIVAAAQSLRPEYMKLFMLYYKQGCTTREISDIVSVPESTIKTRLRILMEELRNSSLINSMRLENHNI